MAMSDSSSSMAQWAGLYHHGPGPGPAIGRATGGGAADSTVVTTTTTSSPTSAGSGGSPTRQQPGIEGRVGKSARRRSRASRRAPVTLLNTDTTNFRAMVQQFTGIPSGPYSSGNMAGGGGGPVINFGVDYSMPLRPSAAAVMSFDRLQQRSFQDQLFRPQQQQLHHQQQHQYNETAGFMQGGGNNSSNHSDMFVHGFSADQDRMFLESMQAAQMLPRPASTNNTNGYFG